MKNKWELIIEYPPPPFFLFSAETDWLCCHVTLKATVLRHTYISYIIENCKSKAYTCIYFS